MESMSDFPNANTIIIAVLALVVGVVQAYNTIKARSHDTERDADQLKAEIIKDYETRLKQVEQQVLNLTAENSNLTGQLQSIRDLPLKQMADSIGVIVKSQAIISDTQAQIIKLLTAKVVETS